MSEETCHNCGMPADVCRTAPDSSNPDTMQPAKGRRIQISRKAENGYQRCSTRTVWCCSDECAIQALAIAKFGIATHNWPITLAQFRGTRPLEGLDRAKTLAETRINTGAVEGLFGKVGLDYGEGVSARNMGLKTRNGGRPRKWASNSERMRAYRRRVGELVQ